MECWLEEWHLSCIPTRWKRTLQLINLRECQGKTSRSRSVRDKIRSDGTFQLEDGNSESAHLSLIRVPDIYNVNTWILLDRTLSRLFPDLETHLKFWISSKIGHSYTCWCRNVTIHSTRMLINVWRYLNQFYANLCVESEFDIYWNRIWWRLGWNMKLIVASQFDKIMKWKKWLND